MRYDHDSRYNTLISILMIVLGLLLLFWPGHVMTTAVKIVGIALLVGGAITAFSWHRGRGAGVGIVRLAEGILMAVGGLVLLFAPRLLISILPVLLGLFIIVNGGINLMQALDLRSQGYSRWGVSLALAALTILLGLLILFNPFSTMEMLVAAIGGIIFYNGISNLWIESRYRNL